MSVQVQRRILLALLIVAALFGGLRLNPFCLLEPDSPDYLVTARALSVFEGYRAPYLVDEPLQTFRPPGLPLLLAPLARIAPYQVVPAKVLILGTGLLMLALLFVLARRAGTARSALIVVALCASGPYFMLHATEVMTEAPYLATFFGLILLATGDGKPTRGRLVLGSILLTYLPFLRTIGLALVAAIAIWAALRRERRPWWIAVAVALTAQVLWSLRGAGLGGQTYLQSVFFDLHRSGLLDRISQRIGYYAQALSEVTLPGLAARQPLYERLLLGDAANLGLPGVLVLVLFAIVAGLSLTGMLVCRRQGGGLALLYVAVYLVALIVYPPQHPRLAWPLVPLLLAFVPAGFGRWIHGSIGIRFVVPEPARRPLWIGAVSITALFGLWQLGASLAIVRVNLKWLAGQEAFYATASPPFYFSDFQRAGQFIHEETAPTARLLTRHSDVGFTARRYLESIRFAERPPVEWRGRVTALPASYLVVSTSRYGKWFHWRALNQDPIYRFRPVYEDRLVMVLEVGPNLEGTVSPVAPDLDPWLDPALQASERDPERIDLAVRAAELLDGVGRRGDAIERLESMVAAGAEDARLDLLLGRLLVDADRPGLALEVLERAAARPRARYLARTIERRLEAARQAIEAHQPSVAVLVEQARGQMANLAYDLASASIARALEKNPDFPPAIYVNAELKQRFGEFEQARDEFRRALDRGVDDAARKLWLIEGERALAEGASVTLTLGGREVQVEPSDPSSWETLARGLAADGTPGRALSLLSRGLERFPESPALKRRLAEAELFYGRVVPAERLLSEGDADPELIGRLAALSQSADY